MVDYNVALLLYRNTLALLCAVSISVSPATYQGSHNLDIKSITPSLPGAIATKPACLPGRQSLKEIASSRQKAFLAMTDERIPSVSHNDRHETTASVRANPWPYLRKGINYLEASGKELPLHYKHPGGKAYGPLALTPIAIKDVRLHYPSLAHYTFDDVLSNSSLYEKFAYFYAELLLKHYIKVDYLNMPEKEVFDILQKAWFLGPGLYKKGHPVIASRETRAKEFIGIPFPLTAHTT